MPRARRNEVRPLTKKQIALLHVAKNKLGLDEGNYRTILSVHGGVESAKDLTLGGFERVMKYMERLGFAAPTYAKGKRRLMRDADALIEAPQQYKITQLFEVLGIDTAERRQAFCRRVIKKAWAQTRGEANKIIEGLKAMQRRREAGTS
jgi:hypothetical protein|nr:MAG TPA: Protein of unknown function (DUF1018) [Bacteriophage sp.]